MAIPEDHLAKFHKMTDAKEMWETIKSRFGGNDESKKMQKYILKQQFESFSVSNSEGLHKGYDRTKEGVDTLSFDELYNNLRVFKSDVKGSTRSSSSTQNVAFVSSNNTSSTNEVNAAYGVFTSFGHNSQRKALLHTLMNSCTLSFLINPVVSMISMRLKKFYKKTERKLHFDAKEPVGFDKNKVECFNCHNTWHFARECRSKGNQESRRRDARNTGHKARDNMRRPAKQDEPKAMVTIDGEGVNWTGLAENNTEDYALIAFNSSNSGSDTEMSAKDKSGLGYGTQIHEGVLSYENEVLESVFESQLSDIEDCPVNDRFVKVKGMHAALPPMTRIYMPPKSDFRIDESKFTYGPKQFKNSESDAKTSDLASCESNSSVETLEFMSQPVESIPKAVSERKVWFDAPIIKEYESDSDNENVSKATVEQEIPSCASINTVKHLKSPRQTVKDQDTCSQKPKVYKRDWTSLMSKKLGLGYGHTRKACFVCGSFSHLIKDCDFHEKKMAKQVEFNKRKNKVTCKRNDTPVWNNVQILNHQNKFVPTSILTKTGIFPVNSARQKFSSQAASTSIVRKVNTARLIVNEMRPRNNMYKSHSPIRKPFNRTTTPKANFIDHKVNTVRDKTDSAVGGNRKTAVKTSTDTECLVLSPDFKLIDENQVLLRVPRQNNMYSFNLENIVPSGVSTACYVLNRVLVTKPQNKTPYELLTGKIPIISYIRRFGCHVTILNTIDHLGKFEEKSDKGSLVGYSLNSKAFRPVTLENKANKTTGPKEANNSAGIQDNLDARNSQMEAEHVPEYFLLPLWSSYTLTVKCSTTNNGDKKLNEDTGSKINKEPVDQEDQAFLEELEKLKRQEKEANDAAKTLRKTTPVNTASTPVKTASLSRNVNDAGPSSPDLLTYVKQDDSQILSLEDIYVVPNDGIFTSASYDAEGVAADFKNLESFINVSPIPQSRIHSIHPTTQILGDPNSAVQTRSKVNKSSRAHALIEPKKNSQALEDKSWVDAMQEELLQFKTQQGHRQEEGIDYNEVFAYVARLEAIRIFLAFASYLRFIVYQIDMKSAFLYGKINEEVYVSQPPGFIDPKFPKKVYKVVKSLYGLHQAPRAWYATLSTFLVQSGYRRGLIDKTLFIKKDQKDIMLVQVYVDDIIFGSIKKSWCDKFEALMKNKFQMSSIGELTSFLSLQVKQKEDGIFISHEKYVVEILKKFEFMSVKTASTPIETKKPLVKDAEAADVTYITASRPDIMYAVCACSRFQVTSKTLHQAVKRIFRYLKGQSKLGLWYSKESAFDLEAYSDSGYARTNLDRKSKIGEYVAVANCYGQVLWIQNQMLDYGFNFMNTKIYIDNESTICNFNKLDDLVGKGADYAVNKGRSTDKIKVLNAKAEGVSAAGETLSTATLAVSTVSVQPVLVLLKLLCLIGSKNR
nr:hypothetical protein [Tanacetum cinerariifolium]